MLLYYVRIFGNYFIKDSNFTLHELSVINIVFFQTGYYKNKRCSLLNIQYNTIYK
jgi:hypothetical protein